MNEIEELIEELTKRLGDNNFEHTIDRIEWTDKKYNHQN